jgi:hypothetical protein
VALLHQAPDTLDHILAAYVSGWDDVSQIPANKPRSEDGTATGEFKILDETKVDQFSRHFVEKSQQRVNLSVINMRDEPSIELVPVRAEEAVDRLDYLAREDLGH